MNDTTRNQHDITRKQPAFSQYEYVDVEFGVAHMDLVVPYTTLRLEDRDAVRWLDVSPGGNSAGIVGTVYRVQGSAAVRFPANAIVVRSTLANYSTRLLLFVERNER